MNRRSVLQALALTPLAFILPKMALASGKAAAAAPANALGEQEPLSKAMKYVADASKAGAERADKKATCANCNKFNKCSAADAGCKLAAKGASYAPCEMFPGKTVAAAGWCSVWAKI